MLLTTVEWICVALGFFAALTLVYLGRRALVSLWPPPAVASHFSPKGGCTDRIVRELAAARHEILVLAYSFTSNAISKALVEAKTRGVHVEIVLDHSNETEDHTDLPFLLEQGLAPLIDPAHAIAHNKVMIIDHRTLITGSFNFTRQAEIENAENLLILKGYSELVSAYRTDFSNHKSHARKPEIKKGQTSHQHRGEGAAHAKGDGERRVA
ncbi:MAG TPA: phospholipase D family protein [Gemmataceae bacterium]|nr:phospholipase D family protein [Gemmataceae bacterium]